MILHCQSKYQLLSLRMNHWLGFYGSAEGKVAKPRRNQVEMMAFGLMKLIMSPEPPKSQRR